MGPQSDRSVGALGEPQYSKTLVEPENRKTGSKTGQNRFRFFASVFLSSWGQDGSNGVSYVVLVGPAPKICCFVSEM